MKSVCRFILPAVLAALPIYGDQPVDVKVDAPALKFFESLHPHRPDPSVWVDSGSTHYNWTKDWHFTFFNLPLLAPLPGARLEDGCNIPNPFDLTGGIPYTNIMPPWLSGRSAEVEREYHRIETMSRTGHFKLTLTGDGSH